MRTSVESPIASSSGASPSVPGSNQSAAARTASTARSGIAPAGGWCNQGACGLRGRGRGSLGRARLELQLVEAVINSARREQLLVRARLAELPLVQDEDAVHPLDGREAMGNRDGGTTVHDHLQRVADQQFGFGIDARGGFVEDQDARIERERARE